MRRSYWIAVALVLVAVIAAGAAWWATRPPDEPVTLRVVAGPRGSDGHKLMSEVAEVVERRSSTLRLDVKATGNSSVNMFLLRNGGAEVALIEANAPPVAGLRFVADLFPDHFLLLTRAAGPMREVTDLPGVTIAVPEAGTAEQRAFWAMIGHYGVTPGTFRFKPMGVERAARAYLDGEIDAMFFLTSLRDPNLLAFVEEAYLRDQPLRLVPLDQAAAMGLKRPFLSAATVVKGAFNGNPPLPAADVTTASLHRLLVSRDDVDDAAVAELTRVLFDNRLDLVIRLPLTSAIAGPTEDGVSLPVHEGARQFYDRDQPSFLQENAEPMAFVVTVSMLLLSGLLALRRAVVARQKNRADKHNHALLALARRAREAQSIAEVRAVRADLFALMEEVVEALDVDRVSEEGFQSFSMIWESVRSLTRDRIAELEAG